MTISRSGLLKGMLLAGLLHTAAIAAADTVEVCHIPPGDPESAEPLLLPPPAAEAHLGHGDVPGPCGFAGPNLTSLGTLVLLTAGWAGVRWSRRPRKA